MLKLRNILTLIFILTLRVENSFSALRPTHLCQIVSLKINCKKQHYRAPFTIWFFSILNGFGFVFVLIWLLFKMATDLKNTKWNVSANQRRPFPAPKAGQPIYIKKRTVCSALYINSHNNLRGIRSTKYRYMFLSLFQSQSKKKLAFLFYSCLDIIDLWLWCSESMRVRHLSSDCLIPSLYHYIHSTISKLHYRK